MSQSPLPQSQAESPSPQPQPHASGVQLPPVVPPPSQLTPLVPPQRIKKALVVGINSYSRIPLSRAVTDATDLHAALKRVGYDATLVTNCSIADFDAAKNAFLASLHPGVVGLFYFAGHGVEAAVQQGSNFESSNWLMGRQVARSNSELPRYALDAQALLVQMERKETLFNCVILDCCRDNPLPDMTRTLSSGIGAMLAPAGSFIAFACAPKQRAADFSMNGRNGVFAMHLLRHIETPGLRVEDLFIKVGNGVRNDARSNPDRFRHTEQNPYTNSALREIGACLA